MKMKRSHLHSLHEELSAQFTEVTGWEMPLHYGDPRAEYAAVRQAVGITDLSHRGLVRVTGEDRDTWLQSVISNDIRPLTAGSGLYSSFLSNKGKMLTYFRVYKLAEAVMLEDVGEAGEVTLQTLRRFLLYGTKAKLESCAGTWGVLLVSGPQASAVVKEAFEVDVSSLKELTFLTHTAEMTEALFVRTEETGETDVEIVTPADGLSAAWQRLREAGSAYGLKPFGLEAREMLRMEAGLPRVGADLTEDIVPPEANLEGKAFSLTKGCYPGQEVVARMDTYGSVRRRLVGLALETSALPPRGAKLFSGEREVGWISSASHSPALGCPIAFGFPLRDFTKPGTQLAVEIGGQRSKAVVHALPFYPSPRGH